MLNILEKIFLIDISCTFIMVDKIHASISLSTYVYIFRNFSISQST